MSEIVMRQRAKKKKLKREKNLARGRQFKKVRLKYREGKRKNRDE